MKILYKILFLFLFLFTGLFLKSPAFAIGQWTTTGSMVAPHGNTSMIMLQNGSPIVMTGQTQTNITELYNEATGQWTQTGNVNTSRDQITAALLSNGKVLIAGGASNGTILNSAELYDPVSGQWSYTGSLNTARTAAILVTLLDGRVLAISGVDASFNPTTSAEIYDPTTAQWTTTGNSNMSHSDYGRGTTSNAVLLNDGRVLVVGTLAGDALSGEIYDPATAQWTTTGNFVTPRSSAHLIKLQNGKVLMAGGASNNVSGFFAESEIYDPTTNQWTQTGSLNYGRYGSDMVLLTNGNVLIAGGLHIPDITQTVLPSEIYNPSTGIWTVDASLNSGHNNGTMALFPDGKVLMAGGYTTVAITTAEVWTPPTNAPPVINSLANVSINEGSNYATSSSFTDTDSTGWTGAVDYGDGTGSQSLPLNPDKTFSLSHQYKDEGNYTATVSITDNQGATGIGSAIVAVNNAPFTIGSITAPTTPNAVNTSISASASFTDPGVLDTHTAIWNWGDGSTTIGTVTESNGSGTISNTHSYTSAGVYTVSATVTDDDGVTIVSSPFQYVVIFDPSAGFITGSGSYDSQTGWDVQNPTATGKIKFGIHAKYTGSNTIPTGKAKIDFKVGNIELDSTSYQWLVINGAKAILKGNGTINNTGSYTFLISIIDGTKEKAAFDFIRVKIVDSTNTVIYDTQPGSSDTADPTTQLLKSSIEVH